jgi:hypothetical protein
MKTMSINAKEKHKNRNPLPSTKVPKILSGQNHSKALNPRSANCSQTTGSSGFNCSINKSKSGDIKSLTGLGIYRFLKKSGDTESSKRRGPIKAIIQLYTVRVRVV